MSIPRNQCDERKGSSFSIRLEPEGVRWAFALSVLLAAAGFCWEASRVGVAAEFAASSKPELWRRAAQWEPDNSAYWAQLGSREAWDFERGDLKQAAADYEQAVKANPYSDRDWLELAAIYEKLGQIPQARRAYEQARSSHPRSAPVAWQYGNFLLRQGNAPEAREQFRNALLSDPELTENTVAIWWRGGLYAAQPVSNLLPAQNRFYFQALDYFCRQNEIDGALRVWDELLKLGRAIELPQAISVVDAAISAGRVDDAERVWQQALDLSGWPRDTKKESSLVFNGGFEHDFANGGFDWREQESEDAFFAFDTAVAHSGSRSLRVSFSGRSNLDFQHLLQYVRVKPGHRYGFRGYLKSADLPMESGMRFLIEDSRQTGMPPLYTQGVIGTQGWTAIEAEFVTGPATTLVTVVLRRTPSEKFDSKLKGTVWLDDVSLREVTEAKQSFRP